MGTTPPLGSPKVNNPITMQNVPTLSQSQQRYDGMILKTCSTYNYLVARTRGQNKVPVVLKCRAFRWMIFNSIGYSRPTCEIRFLVSFGGSSYGSIHPGLSSSGRRTGMWWRIPRTCCSATVKYALAGASQNRDNFKAHQKQHLKFDWWRRSQCSQETRFMYFLFPATRAGSRMLDKVIRIVTDMWLCERFLVNNPPPGNNPWPIPLCSKISYTIYSA